MIPPRISSTLVSINIKSEVPRGECLKLYSTPGYVLHRPNSHLLARVLENIAHWFFATPIKVTYLFLRAMKYVWADWVSCVWVRRPPKFKGCLSKIWQRFSLQQLCRFSVIEKTKVLPPKLPSRHTSSWWYTIWTSSWWVVHGFSTSDVVPSLPGLEVLQLYYKVTMQKL